MKKIYAKILKIFVYTICLYSGFCGVSRADVCASNQIDVGNGVCENTKFSVTTKSISAGDEFRFYMSAQGTFYIDCGDGGELSGVGVSGVTVSRTDTSQSLYTCAYTTGGVKTIRFAGHATGYNTRDVSQQDVEAIPAIGFYVSTNNARLIKNIDGSLGALFPTLGKTGDKQPNFLRTFYDCLNLANIPADLFSGIMGARAQMFSWTFWGCKSLTSVPSGLFRGISGAAPAMFASTFRRCESLVNIPADLFAGVSGAANNLFHGTFLYCYALTTIPDGLFAGVNGCAAEMFRSTFAYTGITQIPDALFAGVNCAAEMMFAYTFQYNSNLSGYIPSSLFAGLIANGTPYTTSMMSNIFAGTNLATTCPAGTVQFMTGYEDYWDGHVACVDENLVCGAGKYLPSHWYQCESCPENNYCVGGTYSYSESIASGATQCPNNLYSPAGMSSADQCGRILHIGDNVVYLRSVKKTTPSLNVDIDNDGIADFFGNMTISDVVMNSDTDKKLKIQFGGQTYSVYDDTVTVGE